MKNKFVRIGNRPGSYSLIILIFCALYAQMNFSQTTSTCFPPIKEIADPTVSLVYKDTLTIPSFTDFSIPVKMKTGNEISAISLGFYYPEDYLEITGMDLANGIQGYSYSNVDSLFSMAWSDVNAINIGDEGTIITIHMKSLDLAGLSGTIKLGIYEFSEFADQSANVIEGIVLEIPEIEYRAPDTNEFLSGIYPNPFDEYMSINFYLKTESRIEISLFNMVGMEIKQLVDATYPEGSHQVRLYALDLSKGIYFLKFVIRNSEQSGIEVVKIMSIR